MFEQLLVTLNIWLSTAMGRLLAGAGLGLAVASGVGVLFDELLLVFYDNLYKFPQDVLSLLHIAGADTALSYVIGALLARKAVVTAKVFLVKV